MSRTEESTNVNVARKLVKLAGRWRFRLDPKNLGEKFPDKLSGTHKHDARWMRADYDDRDWTTIDVPSCWQAEGFDYNGVAWYRRTFETPIKSDSNEQVWIRFNGVDYFADVWLNGRYLGSHEGYFGQFGFDIKDYLEETNCLVVRVDSPRSQRGEENEIGQPKTIFKGALERWDTNDPEISPGGIWNDVSLVITRGVRIDSVAIRAEPLTLPPLGAPNTCTDAIVRFSVELSVMRDMKPGIAKLIFSVVDKQQGYTVHSDEKEVVVFPGRNTVQVDCTLEDVLLWWTWDLGSPNLYELRLQVESINQISDELHITFGVRRIERRDGWSTYLNGVPFFQRGANYLSDQLLSTMDRDRYATDIKLLIGANLNTVHTFCVVEKPEFYDQCDEAGLLVYQDFPTWMMCSNESDFVRRAITQFRDMVSQLGHHPSIAIWSFGSQPSPANFEKLCSALVYEARAVDPDRIVHQGNSAFASKEQSYVDSERSFFWPLDFVDQALDRHDWRLDTHLYLGWYELTYEHLHEVPKSWLQLVTEFGAQALPRRKTLESFIDADALYPLDEAQYGRRCAQLQHLLRWVEPTETLDQYVEATQQYQAELIKYHVEFYRWHKYRPCNGAHVFCFNDCWPAVTWALVEYDRTPKKAYYALAQSMAPLHILLGVKSYRVKAGREVTLPVAIVNDLAIGVESVAVRCQVRDAKSSFDVGDALCDVPPVAIVDVGSFTWCPEATGEYVVTLICEKDGESIASNEYRFLVGDE